jgi:hypothetical protein
MHQSIRKITLMTLLAIFLAIGPFLFVVPSVVAVTAPDVIVFIDNEDRTYDFTITITSIPFDDGSWTQVGNIYDISANDPIALENELNGDNVVHNVTVLLLVENKYKKWVNELHIIQYAAFCDYNNDTFVDAEDIKLISRANSQPDRYEWRFDLNLDGVITSEDIAIAHTFLGPAEEQWVTLPLSKDPAGHEHVDTVFLSAYNRWYVITQLAHFSGFGIRR